MQQNNTQAAKRKGRGGGGGYPAVTVNMSVDPRSNSTLAVCLHQST